ncbi:MAG: hypothetical protein P8Q24_10565 [Glaciecola sp.]|jgi:hypothetical protein|nr:hypothetical protein [Glaciecola sp.]MDG1469585.1 hypothetical protein [Glaciecola sp.]MDG1922838.1 hypothetical protein [Glaciecola sp.]
MTIIYILVILFLTLFVVTKVIENSKMRISDEDTSKISRWILPLVGVALIVQLIMFMVRG